MNKRWRALLVIVIVASFAIALSYPIRRWMENRSTEQTMEWLVAMRDAALENQQALPEETEPKEQEPQATKEPPEPTESTAMAAEETTAVSDTPGSRLRQSPQP